MTLILELPPELETKLGTEAARLGLPISDYILRILAEGAGPQQHHAADHQEHNIPLTSLYALKKQEILRQPTRRTREEIEKLLESNETFAQLIEELGHQHAG